MKSVLKNTGLAVLMAVVALTLSVSVKANNDKDKKGLNTELKFVGVLNNQPVFQLNLNAEEAEEYIISITGENGTLFYIDKVKGTNITRKYAINEEVGDSKLRIEVRSRTSNKKEVYNIERVQNFVEETVVSRVQ